ARSLGSRNERDALAPQVADRLVDLTAPLQRHSALVLLTDAQPEALEVYRHGTAHLLAQAVQQLFPDAKVGIGPVIDGGFYDDFEKAKPFTPEDLGAIEERMHEIAQRELPI